MHNINSNIYVRELIKRIEKNKLKILKEIICNIYVIYIEIRILHY